MDIAPERVRWLKKQKIAAGSHTQPNGEACIMECVAYLAGERWTDSPECASPVIAAFMRNWNDCLDDKTRQKLKPYAPKLLNSRGSEKLEERRAVMALDWSIRTSLPAWLELAKLNDEAKALRACGEITDRKSLEGAGAALKVAHKKAAAAWAAVGDAARDAVGAHLAPTVKKLQASAFELLDRMIAAE